MWRIPAACLLMLLGLSGCDAGSMQGEIPQCRCDIEQCSSASCGYDLRLDDACKGQLDFAEVLIDGHLEAEVLEPGGSLVPCTRAEPGVAAQLIIRGGDWVWGPLNERCTEPGENRLLVLQCVEAL